MPTNKALIVLQENSGRIELPPGTPPALAQAIFSVTDQLAERFEDLKTLLQSANRYDVVHLLTDNLCSRSPLLNTLITEAQKSRTVDLIVLGHGSSERLVMKRGPALTGGPQGNIRSLLVDARKRGTGNFTLRMVYMCNCYGSTLNDDWIAIGAKASVGSKMNNYMPEPMITYFVHNWLGGQKVRDAAKSAYDATAPLYSLVYPPTLRPQYVTHTVTYPCPTLTDLTKMCKNQVTLPSGRVDVIPNDKVTQSEPGVGGNGNLQF